VTAVLLTVAAAVLAGLAVPTPGRGRAVSTATTSSSRRLRATVLLGSVVTVATVTLTTTPLPAAAGGATAVVGLLVLTASRRRTLRRARAARVEAAPAVLDLLGACLAAGLNPHLSLLRAAERGPEPLREELEHAAAQLRLGRGPGAALRSAAERTGLDELRAAAGALEAAERWGGPPAEALAARAEALRSRARLQAEAAAGRAAVRLAFPLVLCFLPAFVPMNVDL
jgi:tight adherence protein C